MPRLFTIATILAAITLLAGISGQTVDASPQSTDATSADDENLFGEVADIEDADADSGFESADTDAPVEETPYRLPSDSSLPEAEESDVNELIHHPESRDYDEHDIVRGDFDRGSNPVVHRQAGVEFHLGRGAAEDGNAVEVGLAQGVLVAPVDGLPAVGADHEAVNVGRG